MAKEPKKKQPPIREANPMKSIRDPEYDVPDPEQTERDIEEAEEIYRREDRKKSA